VKSDPGAASAALLGRDGHDLAYLNITPRQGSETLAGWASFRPRHNAQDGERDISVQAAAGGLRFRAARGSCVQDAYTTSTGRRYIEIACLLAGAHASTVVVAAALAAAWGAQRAPLERAIDSVTS
jgi:hypothetical protein